MDNTFFKIYRSLLDDPLWLSEPFTYGQAWVDLIGLANFADKDKFYRGQYQRVKRGQVVTSQQALAERWSWGRRKVSTFLRNLESAKMCTVTVTPYGTTITIEKYAFYQDTRTAKSTTDGTAKSTTDAQRTHNGRTHNKKDKEGKEEIYIPSRADVAAYVSDKALPGDPDEIYDYYEAVGWEINGKPIKDWKAVVRRWKSYGKPKQAASKEDEDAELHRLLEIMEKGGNIYDTTGG